MRNAVPLSRKYTTTSADYSLFMVSNVDNNYCFIYEDEIEYEREYTTFIVDYSVFSETVYIPGLFLTIMDMSADINSATCLSNMIFWNSVEDIHSNHEGFNIYPNPANDFLQIQGAESGDIIEVWDVHGKKII